VNTNGHRSTPGAIALDSEDRLPATELEIAVDDRDGYTFADEHRPNMAVGVVVDLVVLPAVVGNEVIECGRQIVEQPRFGFVDDDAHRRVLTEDGTDAVSVVRERRRQAVGNINALGSAVGLNCE